MRGRGRLESHQQPGAQSTCRWDALPAPTHQAAGAASVTARRSAGEAGGKFHAGGLRVAGLSERQGSQGPREPERRSRSSALSAPPSCCTISTALGPATGGTAEAGEPMPDRAESWPVESPQRCPAGGHPMSESRGSGRPEAGGGGRGTGTLSWPRLEKGESRRF